MIIYHVAELYLVEHFFSAKYAGEADIFNGLKISEERKYRDMEGTWPVISISFANVKEPNYEMAKRRICQVLTDVYNKNQFLLDEYDTPMQEAYVEGYWKESPDRRKKREIHITEIQKTDTRNRCWSCEM